ncbi:MAG: hypothetical protein M3389_13995, partial [Actinomycetota bacterium]|nr:hypothetical protein [Actinomycetota bacterium]
MLKPLRGALLLAALAVVSLVAAPLAHAVEPTLEQVPLELRPSQGPAGTDTILYADGWTPGEAVDVYVDGTEVATEVASAQGVAARIVDVPDTVGLHRIVLRGATSDRSAGGTFRTTATGAERTALLASPRPLGPSGDPDYPLAVRYLVANFPATKEIEGFYYWDVAPDNGYYEFPIGTADANGRFDGTGIWGPSDFGVVALAIGEPADSDPLVAVDALIAPDGYTAQR